jgi:excisionase family DNA binding protein
VRIKPYVYASSHRTYRAVKYRQMLDATGTRLYVADMPADNLLDKDQAADRLNIGRWHLEALIRRRDIPFVKVGRLIRFDPADLDAWLDANRTEAL